MRWQSSLRQTIDGFARSFRGHQVKLSVIFIARVSQIRLRVNARMLRIGNAYKSSLNRNKLILKPSVSIA